MLFSLIVSCVLSLLPLSVSGLSSPPSGSITIGPGGKYATISSALADTSSSVYFIFAGTFKEQVTITRSNIKIFGQTNVPKSYTGNTVTITNSIPASTAGSNDASGTSQAIALSVQDGQFGAYGLKLTGFQWGHTPGKRRGVSVHLLGASLSRPHGVVYTTVNTTVTVGSRGPLTLMAPPDIRDEGITVSNGWITASGRSSNDANWYVINSSTVQGTGTVFLGRPWREFARVLFQNTYLHSNVPPAGWSPWNSTSPTNNVVFAEFNNTGPGAVGPRASFSTQLKSPTSINTVLGSTSWIDSQFL
ncbi:hypothetical protein NLI96_g6152 [Meripilus lineatus]|uniref:pectinesterase n=1 Tax=Meripilus lineatus TaxID=2056292 RepID=A0AAD5YG77_9APHY|nr:hypothetical protein NLI96_g6152 [Physisporinus lineatus]